MKEGYKKTELGWIPEEWEIKQLNDISEIIMGQSPDSDTYNDSGEGVPFFQGKTEFGRMSPIIKKWCTKPTKIAKPLDILVSVRAPVGEVNINVEESCIGRGLAAIRGKNSNYKFIYYYMQSIKTKLNSSAQGSTFTAINSNDLKEVKTIVPPLKEQEKIADVLSTVDSQIDDTDKLIEKTKVLKKGLMKRLLTKGIGHTEFKKTEVGEIPVEWEFYRLNNITYLNPESLGNSTDQNLIINYIDIESVKVGKVLEYKEFQFSEAPSRARRVVAKNDVIVSTVRPNLKSIAKINFDKENLVCSTGFAVLRKKGSIDSEYLFQYVMSDIFTKQLTDKTVGSNYPAVNSTDIKETLIFVPPLDEQEKIADILSSVDMQIEEYENKKTKLEELKKGFMQKLLTGKIRVN